MPEADLVSDHICLLGEGPVWDASRKSINWIDILNGRIHELFVLSRQHRVIELGEMVGAIAIHAGSGEYLAALQSGISVVDRETGAKRMLVHPELNKPRNRFNDGKYDPAGRFWVSTMSLTEEQGAGNLYMIEKDLEYKIMIEGTTIGNGLAWSSDQKTFYFIDTPTRTVSAFDYDIESGNITNKRVVITIPENEGFPDGMTIDSEDMLWIAHYGGWQVSRWNPVTGEKIRSIPLPVEHVTSCTFGGEDLNDLYITTARKDLDEKQLAEQSLAGNLFVVRDILHREAGN